MENGGSWKALGVGKVCSWNGLCADDAGSCKETPVNSGVGMLDELVMEMVNEGVVLLPVEHHHRYVAKPVYSRVCHQNNVWQTTRNGKTSI